MKTRHLCLLAVLAVAACGDTAADTPATATIDTLPNGALLVRNPATGVWDSASTWRFEEELRIGALEGEGPDVFAQVHDIEVDALGRVWVLDKQLKKIEVFGSDGRHVRTVGRPGAGPGELEDPTGMEFDASGRLWVEDPRNARYTIYDTTGAALSTVRRESNLFTWQWQGGIAQDGRIFGVDVVFEEGAEPQQVIVQRDSAGAVTDTFEIPAFEEQSYRVTNDDGRAMMAAGIPFASTLVWRIDDDGTLWFGETGEYRILRRSMDGDTLRIIEKEWTPIPVTQAERDTALDGEFYDQMRAAGADLDPARIPANKPAWNSFWFDDQGHLWVAPVLEPGAGRAADVFDPDGVYLGRVVLPAGLSTFASPPVIRGGRMWLVLRDEFDVSYVVIGRLEGRD